MRRPFLIVACVAALFGCQSELGECDEQAAKELVYNQGGRVATKGQALAHDSCGNGSFCHAASARGESRFGVAAGLNFDMVPSPTGLSKLREYAELSWQQVESGQMPPRGRARSVQGDGDWLADPQRRSGAPRLPRLDTREGKGVFRNWLACGAPVVRDTKVAPGVQPGTAVEPTWRSIRDDLFVKSCAIAGCHDTASSASAGGLDLSGDCDAYAALFVAGACNEPAVRAGQPEQSLLVDKLTATRPRCGSPMPPGGLDEGAKAAVRDWIRAGAVAEGCSR